MHIKTPLCPLTIFSIISSLDVLLDDEWPGEIRDLILLQDNCSSSTVAISNNISDTLLRLDF